MSPRRLRARFDDERGAVAVIVALLLVVLGGSAAMTFDLARLRHERHMIQAAVDLGSLAGAALLPVATPAAAAVASNTSREVAVQNAPELATSGLTIDFACVVSDPEGDGGSNSFDLTFACGPNGGSGTWTNWTSRGGKAIHSCNPNAGDLCNTIRLTASSTVDYYFAPLLGFDSGNTGAVRAAACKGFCGQASSPLDVVFVIDRTNSMSTTDITNLKRAIVNTTAAEDSVLEFYDPADVSIGVVALPYQSATNPCAVSLRQDYPKPVPPTANQYLWQVHGFSNDYRIDKDSPINPGSSLVQLIQCLQRAPANALSYPPSGGSARHTNHGDSLMAAQALLDQGREDAPDVIIFFADGQANQPDPFAEPCQYAYDKASAAKVAGTSIFALGYGVDGTTCAQDGGASSFRFRPSTTFLAAVSGSTGEPASTDDAPNGCGINENRDGDFYFCESRGEDLRDVFKRIAIQSIQRSRLLNF
ncbi:MAG: hypothetical protein ACXWXK_08345 [Actinomycetota bacterium]